jgi:hypothetical protein
MANIVAAKTGNWSDPTVWVGGVLPGANDIAITDNYTITIDQNVTCTKLSNEAVSGHGSGHYELVGTMDCVINAIIESYPAAGVCLQIYSAGLTTINGNCLNQAVRVNAALAVVVVNGNVIGGINLRHYGISATQGQLTVNGYAKGGTGLEAVGVYNLTSKVYVERAIGNDYGPGGINSSAVGVSGNGGITASIETFVKYLQWGTYGMCPVSGTIKMVRDDTNEALLRDSTDGSEIALTVASTTPEPEPTPTPTPDTSGSNLISSFFNYIRGKIALASWFTDQGFTNQTVYRQFLPQVKDPNFPCITFGLDPEKREVFATIDDTTLYIGVHTKTFTATEFVANSIKDLLHKHQYSDDNLIIYKCLFTGGSPMPMFDKALNIWEVVLEFECSVG